MNKRWLKLAAVPIAFTFVAAACGSDDDSSEGSDDTAAESADTAGEATEGTTEEATEAPPPRAARRTSEAQKSRSPVPSGTTRRSPRSMTP